MGSTAYSETYTYNSADGSLNTMTTGVGNTLTMGYDGLRRLSTVTGGPFNRSYTYRNISSTSTTMQVSQLSYPNLGSDLSFGYTYDSLGNIATYTAPDGEVIRIPLTDRINTKAPVMFPTNPGRFNPLSHIGERQSLFSFSSVQIKDGWLSFHS